MFVCWNFCPYWADFPPYRNRSFCTAHANNVHNKLDWKYCINTDPRTITFSIFKVCMTQSADLSVFVLFFLFFLLLRSADKVGRPFCFCSVSSYYFFSSFLFFFTATCEPRFLRHFSTDLDDIWHVDSPWWDEQTEYFFKSIGLGVGIRRGPKVLLCFIIGKTLYTVRRDKNFT